MAQSSNDPRETVAAILNDIESMVDEWQIIAYMKRALYRGEGFDEALEECFRAPGPTQANARQAADFRSAARRIWQQLETDYDRGKDEPIALLREKLLELIQRQTDWIRWLDQRRLQPEMLPREPMTRLGQLSGMLDASLELLERDQKADPAEVEAMLETLEQAAGAMENLIGLVEAHIGTDDDSAEPKQRPGDTPQSVFVLKVSLNDIRPPIWRRIRIPGSYTLDMLHRVIQDSMGWENYHLHDFTIGDTRYMDPEQVDELDDEEDESEVTLDSLGLREKQKFRYSYDFGDDWRHTIAVERITAAAEASAEELTTVRCLAGKRACPPEDCGGPPGYADLLELLRKREEELDEDDVDRIEWLGGDFDPEEFDLQEVNELLEDLD